jgi:transposase-like protein
VSKEKDLLKCPTCGNAERNMSTPVVYDEKTQSFVCFKCGYEWRVEAGKPVKVNWTVKKGH